jgi:hypothetical protein
MKNFKRNTLRAAAAIALAALAVGSYAATSASNTATAEVVTPLGITAGTELNFGTIAGGDAVGTVIMSAAGARDKTGDAQLLAGTTPTAATFNVTGAAGKTYAVTLPADGIVTLTGQTDDTKTMAVNTFTYSAASGQTPTIAGHGTDTISVGGTLSVGATQTSQTYQGSFNVSVIYN